LSSLLMFCGWVRLNVYFSNFFFFVRFADKNPPQKFEHLF
jgi:hypothetical protein